MNKLVFLTYLLTVFFYCTNDIVFNQGDIGNCWYIILYGSVNVIIAGKGIVCTLHKGDDFGKLALVNDAPRAATIITNEPNCQFLVVDKINFDKILRNVESNTIRLREHGKEVLILQKMPNQHELHKYMIMAGNAEKILEHIIETRLNDDGDDNDTMLLDFILTHLLFINEKQLCLKLMKYYKLDSLNIKQEKEFVISNKKRIIKFLTTWMKISVDYFLNNPVIWKFVDELNEELKKDNIKYEKLFLDEIDTINEMMEIKNLYNVRMNLRGVQKWKADLLGPIKRLYSDNFLKNDNFLESAKSISVLNKVKWSAIHPDDELICRVYCADHTYTTLKININTKAEKIIVQSAEKLGMAEKINELILVEVKSDNEIIIFHENQISISTVLSINGRLFISHIDHLDALVTLSDQSGPISSHFNTKFNNLTSHSIGYNLTYYDWNLFYNINYHEIIYKIFNCNNHGQYSTGVTSNLDIFLRHFNQIQYWIITELLFEKSLSKRVNLLKKFIKIAGHCKELQNLNAFFAIIMGLSNISINRLTQTWNKLPGKFKRIYNQYESFSDPSRNHRKYRLLISKMKPPIIPFMPLLLKDITFINQGNKTFIDDGLINFEKMHLISQTLQNINYCQSSKFEVTLKINQDLQNYFQELQVIDNQKRLNQLSYFIEHRKT